jgi:diamine N-acetyltransferase
MIFGERLRLRAAEREDIPRFVAWFNDPEVTQNLARHYPMSLATEERWFDNMISLPPAEQALVIEIRDGEAWKAIGNTSFITIDKLNRSAEIGIVIGEKAYWNQGYGRDTMRGIKAYENAGFKHEGRMRQAAFLDGRYYDVLFMSVLSEEFLDQQN